MNPHKCWSATVQLHTDVTHSARQLCKHEALSIFTRHQIKNHCGFASNIFGYLNIVTVADRESQEMTREVFCWQKIALQKRKRTSCLFSLWVWGHLFKRILTLPLWTFLARFWMFQIDSWESRLLTGAFWFKIGQGSRLVPDLTFQCFLLSAFSSYRKVIIMARHQN